MKFIVGVFTLVLSCVMQSRVCAQHQQRIDSLLQKLKVSSYREASNIHLELCYEYAEGREEFKVLHHAKLAYNISKKTRDSLNIVEAGRIIGRCYRISNQLDSSIAIVTSIIPLTNKSNLAFEYGKLLNSLGATYILKASYAEALKCLFESLSVMEKLDNKRWISTSLLNIGFAYYKIEDYAKALEYCKRAYNLKQAINYQYDMDLLLINIGLCYTYMGNYQEAKRYIKLALEVCHLDCTDHIKMQVEYAYGVIAFRQNQIAESERYLLQSYLLAYEIDNKRLLLDNVVMLSQVLQMSNKFEKAEKYLLDAEQFIAETSYGLETIRLYKELSLLYERKGNLKKMAYYQKKYIHSKDSIYNDDYTNKLMRVQAEYLEHENKTRLAAQQQMLDLKDKIIVRQNLLNILAGIAAILLILIVCILYRNNKQRKIANHLLDQKVKERTRELESSYNQLRNRLEEEDLTVKKAMTDVRSAVATMKGLRSLAVKESVNSESVKQMELLDLTLGRLVEALKGVSEPVVNSSDESGN